MVLIATDACARGIDIAGVALVVNFELPRTPTVYTQRVGRAGRFGKAGTAITLIVEDDMSDLAWIESKLGYEIELLVDSHGDWHLNVEALPGREKHRRLLQRNQRLQHRLWLRLQLLLQLQYRPRGVGRPLPLVMPTKKNLLAHRCLVRRDI